MGHITFESLSEYSDARCDPRKKNEIDEHLAGCPSCRKILFAITNTNAALKKIDPARLSASFDLNFNVALDRRRRASRQKGAGLVFGEFLAGIKDALSVPAPALAGLTVFAAAAIFIYGVLGYYPVESPTVISGNGDFTVMSGKEKKEIKGSGNIKLSRGDTVEVPAGSFIDIRQMGRYTIRVKEGSSVTLARPLPRYIRGTVLYKLSKGKAFVSIERAFKGSRLQMKTPEALATAFGTMFVADVSPGPETVTRFSVLEGNLRVGSAVRLKGPVGAQEVVVRGGEATEVLEGRTPGTPRELAAREWAELSEFYQIGQKVQVALLISDGPNRARELLRPCPLYISDVEPKTVGESLEKTISLIDEAVKTNDRTKHLQGIEDLEGILAKYPNASYEPQLLLFIGSYYNYVGKYEYAIRSFLAVSNKYPRSTFASLALRATGIVYENGIRDESKARYYNDLILRKYPRSPEAVSIRELGKK